MSWAMSKDQMAADKECIEQQKWAWESTVEEVMAADVPWWIKEYKIQKATYQS